VRGAIPLDATLVRASGGAGGDGIVVARDVTVAEAPAVRGGTTVPGRRGAAATSRDASEKENPGR
jgi:hypothetical protein